MKPEFRIVADGKNITALINDRLLTLRTSDKPGMESDEFEVRIDDRDGAVALPSRGANIEIFMGYAGLDVAGQRLRQGSGCPGRCVQQGPRAGRHGGDQLAGNPAGCPPGPGGSPAGE